MGTDSAEAHDISDKAMSHVPRKRNRAKFASLRKFGQRNAAQTVARAVRYGMLPKLDGAILCKDCGAPAVAYDHRD